MDDEKVLHEILTRMYKKLEKEYPKYEEGEIYNMIYDEIRSLVLSTD